MKYATEIESLGLAAPCPPASYITANMTAYRFVFEDVDHPSNHKPQGVLKPKRVLNAEDIKRCSMFALSCFDSHPHAEQIYRSLIENFKNFGRDNGTCIAEGLLDEDDGFISEIDDRGHFDLHEFEACDLVTKFTVIQKID